MNWIKHKDRYEKWGDNSVTTVRAGVTTVTPFEDEGGGLVTLLVARSFRIKNDLKSLRGKAVLEYLEKLDKTGVVENAR
jgi:hypothetical protein